jgi:hypothetical protein
MPVCLPVVIPYLQDQVLAVGMSMVQHPQSITSAGSRLLSFTATSKLQLNVCLSVCCAVVTSMFAGPSSGSGHEHGACELVHNGLKHKTSFEALIKSNPEAVCLSGVTCLRAGPSAGSRHEHGAC